MYAWPYPVPGPARTATALAIVLVPAALMVSTIRFRSFKTINFGWGPSYMPVFCVRRADRVHRDGAARSRSCFLAYSYLLSAFIEMLVTRLRRAPRRCRHRQRTP